MLQAPGSVEGEGFVIDGCEDCDLRIFDQTGQIFIDYCKNTKVDLLRVAAPNPHGQRPRVAS